MYSIHVIKSTYYNVQHTKQVNILNNAARNLDNTEAFFVEK